MLLVDNRIGSNDLHPALKAAGLPVELVKLDFADVCFEGRGDGDTSVDVGIELKKLPDLIQSLRDGRLQGHQLPGMAKAYEYSWLIVEGQWSTNKVGLVTIHSKTRGWATAPGKMTGSELEKKLLTLEMVGGVHIRFCNDRRATLRFIANLYHWFTDKSMDRHSTHLDTHRASGFLPISEFRAIVKDHFPGIGLRASRAVEEAFKGSLTRASTATVDEWARIEIVDRKGKVRRVGSKHAEEIVRFCHGG